MTAANLDSLPAGVSMRPIAPDEFTAFAHAASRAFGEDINDEDDAHFRDGFEFERSLAVFDGPQIVGTAGAYSLAMTVPGGPQPVAGVTVVSVAPTHRRRRLLTALMTQQLHDLGDRGEPVATLWASESAIYGRFGYGLASRQATVTVRRGEGRFRGAPADDGQLRLTESDDRDTFAAVYDAAAATRPGFFARDDHWWRDLAYDPERHRDGASPLVGVVHETRGSPDGYALYRTKWASEAGLPAGELRVAEMIAATPTAYAAVWRYLLDLDLMASVVARRRPVDDPLEHLLADPRRLRTQVSDGLWVRLVDVRRALAARTYSAPVDVVVEVRDPLLPRNDGCLRLSGDTDGATCQPTGDRPELSLDVVDLGAAYLGGTSLAALARAGRVVEHRPGALDRAAIAFLGVTAPYCPQVF